MDISRPDIKKKKMRRQLILGGCGVVVLAVGGVFCDALEAGSAGGRTFDSVDGHGEAGAAVAAGTGPGTLVPREDKIRVIPAETDATISRIRVLPGTQVKADTIIMDMVDPTVDQQMMDATLALKGAKADLENTRAKVNSNLMVLRAESASLDDDTRQALSAGEDGQESVRPGSGERVDVERFDRQGRPDAQAAAD